MARALVVTPTLPSYVGPLVGQQYEPVSTDRVEAAQVPIGDVFRVYDEQGTMLIEVQHPDYWVRPDPANNPDTIVRMAQVDFESRHRLVTT
jgi:hypothetical protein